MYRVFVFLLLVCTTTNVFAISPTEADSLKAWKSEVITTLNFSQVSFTNWSAGGQSSISATGLIKYKIVYKDSTHFWNNNIDVAFGIIRQGNLEGFAKSDDRIELNSSYGWSAFHNWYYNMSVNMKSQAAAGYKTPGNTELISDFLAPAYMSLSVGMTRVNKEKTFEFQLLPLSGKITYVNNQSLADEGAFGVDPAVFSANGVLEEHSSGIRSEFGGSLKFHYGNKIWENVSFDTKATLFSNYKDKAASIDVDWELLVLMKINKYLTANINSHLIYDEDIDIALDLDKDGVFETSGPRVQFKELFGLGLSYSF